MESDLALFMRRDTLLGLPPCELPSGYRLQWYRPGDEAWWMEIWSQAEDTALSGALFKQQFGAAPLELPRRQCFLVAPDGQAVGTATAWFNDDYHGERWGQVHWVAVVPQYQGRRLSCPLLAAVCERLLELGHKRAYLGTSTSRPRAIRLYRQFDFVPDMRSDEDTAAWAGIGSCLLESRGVHNRGEILV